MNAKVNILTVAVTAGTLVSSALAVDGANPPEPGTPAYQAEIEKYTAIEAVCGTGRTSRLVHGATIDETNNIAGTGLLIAPNMVLVPKHVIGGLFPDAPNQRFYEYGVDAEMTHAASGDPVYTVRFRLNPNGDIGDLSLGGSSYFQVPVKRVMLPSEVCPNDGVQAEHDIAILILADSQNDAAPFDQGWISHIKPSPVAPIRLASQTVLQGTVAGYGPDPDVTEYRSPCCDRGDLRYVDFQAVGFTNQKVDCSSLYTRLNTGRIPPVVVTDDPRFDTGDPGNPQGVVGLGDSGSTFFMRTESGQFIASWGVPHGGGPQRISEFYFSDLWADVFESPMNVYGYPDLLPTDPLDVTGPPGVGGDGYGAGDWEITASDAIAVAAALSTNAWSDWNNDGAVNANDYKTYTGQLEAALNPYHARSLFPLRTGPEDIDGDGRFNVNDALALVGLAGSTAPEHMMYDFNGTGMIDAGDLSILSSVLGTRGNSPGFGTPGPLLFDHGILGDVNRDAVLDENDVSQIVAFELAGGFNNTSQSDPAYDVVYDANLDDMIDFFDAQLLSSALLPGDRSMLNGNPNTYTGFVPDWQRDIRDVKISLTMIAHHIVISAYHSGSTVGAGLDMVKSDWDLGSARSGPDIYRRSNADIPTNWMGVAYAETDGGVLDYADLKYLLESLRDRSFDAVSTDSLLDLWFMDFNADGRLNIADFRLMDDHFMTSCAPGQPCPGVYDWDLNGDGEYTSFDSGFWFKAYTRHSPINQGTFADYNQSCSPECACVFYQNGPLIHSPLACSDLGAVTICFDQIIPQTDQAADCQDLADLVAVGHATLFGAGVRFGDPLYRAELDADLDGLLDDFDKYEVFHELQPGDLDFDGQVTASDMNIFQSIYATANGTSTGDPDFDLRADLNRDGMIGSDDQLAMIGHLLDPECD